MENLRNFILEEEAVSTVEVILILVVLVALVVLFKNQVTSVVNGILTKVTNQTNNF